MTLDYRIQLDVLSEGYDGKTCWVQPRAGTIPPGGAGDNRLPIVVLTMQQLLLSGSDVFYTLSDLRSDDLGKTWAGPTAHDTLARRTMPNGMEAVIADTTPMWHAASGTLLSTGVAAYYHGVDVPERRPRDAAYTTYDPQRRIWSPWQMMPMPDPDKFFVSGPGCVQRFDLENGDILLPIYFRGSHDESQRFGACYATAVCRCRFDGQTLSYVEHGNEMSVPEPRGLYEPSITRFAGRFYLTLRNDVRGYVAVGEDGLHFEPPRPWTFDDGSELGSYCTQQHWVAHSDGLFLVYTRRGLDNDHVFRHRAPLVMAQVDPDRLCVIRETERILLPNNGARYGNHAVTHVSPDEAWVTDCEWMQPAGLEKYGANNRVYAARIQWDRPNRLVRA